MKREPDDSADSVAQDQIRAFVDRIIRLREEATGIKGDIREVYAEAKGNGFDKTVLGKVVNYIEKRAGDASKLQEADALFELYLTAYDGVGTRVATHTHEGIESRGRELSVSTPAATGIEPEDSTSGVGPTRLTPSQLEETQRQGESEQRRDNGSQLIQDAVDSIVSVDADYLRHVVIVDMGGDDGSRVEPAASAVPAGVDLPTSLAGVEGEADRPPIPEPEVHSSWLKSTVVPIRKPVTEAAKEDRSKPNPICRDPAECGVVASWEYTCEACKKAAREKGAA